MEAYLLCSSQKVKHFLMLQGCSRHSRMFICLIFCLLFTRSGPCDITGDVSYEELRAKAYEQGKQGHPLQSIVSLPSQPTPLFYPCSMIFVLCSEVCGHTLIQLQLHILTSKGLGQCCCISKWLQSPMCSPFVIYCLLVEL
jgi:hypothetical protein